MCFLLELQVVLAVTSVTQLRGTTRHARGHVCGLLSHDHVAYLHVIGSWAEL